MLRSMDFDFSPWRLLDEMLGEEPGMGRFLGRPAFGGETRYPRVNIWDSEDSVILDAAVPGVSSEDLDIAVDGNELALGIKVGEGDEARTYERRFELSFPVKNEDIKASCRNGMLRVRLPKAPNAKRRRIAVEAG